MDAADGAVVVEGTVGTGGAVSNGPLVGVVMGSDSDWPVMEQAVLTLDEFGISAEVDVVSAHRMPAEMIEYGRTAHGRGLKVIIAGAGGAAHLPGMLASVTPLPVIGVPVPLRHLDGMDSLLSIVQMPAGVPVATVSVGGARNAGLLAVRILAASDPTLQQAMLGFQDELRTQAMDKGQRLRARRSQPLGFGTAGSGSGGSGTTGFGTAGFGTSGVSS
jgi:5-(carboxyamino)imidazole ribonucleotide mutase